MIENPILKGFNPDPSICKRGEDYYIATSTFEWFPGVQIHHSKDLKNWQLAARPLNRVSQLDLMGIPDSGGVWAPNLTYADNKFWLVYSIMREHRAFKDVRNYVVTADQVEGPWSEPIFLNASGFDPSLFHDTDGKKYVLNMVYDFRNYHPWNYGISLQEFDLDQQKLVGKPTMIFKGTHLQKTEGPVIYQLKGYYYLFTAEGGSQFGHSVTVARSSQLKGPYEVHPQNPILNAWYAPENYLQKTGHGSLIETSNNEWYLTYLATRPIKRAGKGLFEERGFCTLGRETAISKVYWENDWPYIEGGQVAQQFVEESGLPEVPWPKPAKKQTFKDGLPNEFQTLRVPFNEKMGEISEAGLTLFGQESLYSVFEQSLVARRFEELSFTAETQVDFSPEYYQQMAGLVCYYNSKNWTSLQITHDEEKGKILTLLACEGSSLSWPLQGKEIILDATTKIQLKVMVDPVHYCFAYSIDGLTWNELPCTFDTYKLSDDYIAKPFLGPTGSAFTGAFVGVHCNDLLGTRKAATFNYFSYEEIADKEELRCKK
ncbi:glycoside hydrolase family 43 protein [Enterococcus sp. AZ109]|uniref:glycoside hydrolase family 43 protein n=1 Tax=Enterococcus sp. AZ109 TaxID=2774634 RepID=UPI003F256EA7